MAHRSLTSTQVWQRIPPFRSQTITFRRLGGEPHGCAADYIAQRLSAPVAVAALDDDGLAHRVEAGDTHLRGLTAFVDHSRDDTVPRFGRLQLANLALISVLAGVAKDYLTSNAHPELSTGCATASVVTVGLLLGNLWSAS